jgi:hypothetical protein
MPPKRQARKRVAAIEVAEEENRKRGRVTEVSQSEGALDPSMSGSSREHINNNNNNDSSHVRGFEETNRRFNFSCAALENSVYNYSGTSTGCPRDWLKSYERYATMKGWSETNMAMAMPLYLRGPAMAWFDRLPRHVQQDYPQLREAFIQGFELSRTEVLAELDALVSRKQLANEDLDTYMLDIGYRCRRLKRTPEQEFEYTLQGLLPTIKRQVLLQQASTIDDIRRIGKLCELVPDVSMQPEPVPQGSVFELVATLQEKVANQDATIKELRDQGKKQSSRSTGSTGECFKCGFVKCPGKSRARKEKCFAFGKSCRKCGKINHFEKMCKTSVSGNVDARSTTTGQTQTSPNSE